MRGVQQHSQVHVVKNTSNSYCVNDNVTFDNIIIQLMCSLRKNRLHVVNVYTIQKQGIGLTDDMSIFLPGYF